MIEFLTPVSKAIIAHRELLPKGTIGKQLSVHTSHEEFPDLTNVKLAIFGCKENRRDVNYMGLDIHFDTLRMAFYSLFPGNWKHTMVEVTHYALERMILCMLNDQLWRTDDKDSLSSAIWSQGDTLPSCSILEMMISSSGAN